MLLASMKALFLLTCNGLDWTQRLDHRLDALQELMGTDPAPRYNLIQERAADIFVDV